MSQPLDYRTPPPNDDREQWLRIKQKGYWNFVFVRGLLTFGLVMTGMAYTLLAVFSLTTKQLPLPAWPVPLGLASGLAWGMLTWHLSERRYR